jgi:cell division protein ZapB
MLNELNALESKISQVVALCRSLRTENDGLREQLALPRPRTERLAERMAAACAGLNNWPNNCPKPRPENSDPMPNDANFLDITLLGKEYRVACPPDQRAAC